MKKIRQLFLSLLAISSVAYSADFSIGKGWNLLGTSTEIAANTTFTNSDVVVSVWSWDNATSSWRFFSPSTSFTDGGAAYAASKGYSPLTKIPAAQGFWVNAATAFAVSNNTIVTATTTAQSTITTSLIQQATAVASTSTTTNTSMKSTIFKTSYENAKSQPQLHMPQRGASSLIDTAFALADFFQTGNKTLFTATYRYESWIQTLAQATSETKYLSDFDFWNLNADGTYTKKLSFPNGGCLHPRKALVVDFNQDGYPDLFISCHGYDSSPYPGEKSKLILSDGHGGFTVKDVGKVGYWHTASAADVNGDGYPDIVVSNEYETPPTYFLMNNRDGTFTEDKTRLVGANQIYFAIELVDVDGDGKLDLVAGYDESAPQPTVTRVMYGDSSGKFGATSDIIPPVPNRGIVLDFTVVTNNGVRGLYVCRTSDLTSTEGFYKTNALQWVDIKTMIATSVLDQT